MKYFFFIFMIGALNSYAQIGKRFPSERKEVIDPVTGTKLLFLTRLNRITTVQVSESSTGGFEGKGR